MNVLVMGGTRFNGLALVAELVRAGHDVTVLNRGMTEAKLPRSVKRLAADRKDPEQLRQVLGNRTFDVVFDVIAYALSDVQTMVEILDGRCGHYIFVSSTAIYAESNVVPIEEHFPVLRVTNGDYGYNKILCEEYLLDRFRRTGFPATTAVLGMVYGPNNMIPDREQRMFARLLLGRPVLVPGRGRALSQLGHVEDEARALRLMMGNPRTFGQRYNVTGKDAYTAEAYVDLHAKALGVEAKKVFIPEPVMDDLWARLPGRVDRSSGEPVPVPPPGEPSNIPFLTSLRMLPQNHDWDSSVVFSVDKLRQHTGWEPLFTTESAIRHTAEWYVDSGLSTTQTFDWSAEDAMIAALA